MGRPTPTTYAGWRWRCRARYERPGPRPLEAQGQADRVRRVLARRAATWASASRASRAGRARRVRPGDVLPAADLRPALPVGVRPPRPARATTRCASWSSTPGGCASPQHAARPARASPPRRPRLWGLVEQQEWGEVRPLLHPYVRFRRRGARRSAGAARLLAHLRDHPTPEAARGRRRSATARSTAGTVVADLKQLGGISTRTSYDLRHGLHQERPDDGTARSRWQARYEQSAGPRRRLHDAVRGRGRAGVRHRRLRVAGRVPVHPRALPDRLPRPDLDDPAVRRASATPSRPTSATR